MRENGATDEEIEFLLEKRVELNALASGELVAWIEQKLVKHGIAKVLPEPELLTATYRNAVLSRHVEAAVEKLIAEAKAAEIAVPDDLAERVKAHMEQHPAQSWDDAVAEIADTMLDPDNIGISVSG